MRARATRWWSRSATSRFTWAWARSAWPRTTASTRPTAGTSSRGSSSVGDRVRAEAQALANEIVAWRRHLHRHPELSLEEHDTSRFVAERLRSLDIDVHTGIAGTGVAGLLRAKAPGRPALL